MGRVTTFWRGIFCKRSTEFSLGVQQKCHFMTASSGYSLRQDEQLSHQLWFYSYSSESQELISGTHRGPSVAAAAAWIPGHLNSERDRWRWRQNKTWRSCGGERERERDPLVDAVTVSVKGFRGGLSLRLRRRIIGNLSIIKIWFMFSLFLFVGRTWEWVFFWYCAISQSETRKGIK